MALPATPAPRTRARASRSIFSDRFAVRRLVLVLVLARVALLVLSGRVSANVVWPSSDQDRVDHRRPAGRRLDVVVAGSTDVDTGTVDQRRAASVLQGSPTVARQEESGAVRQTMGDSLAVAGLIGLLGVAGAATFLADSIARPVRRAVRVLHSPADGLDQPVRLTTRDELPDAATDTGSPDSAHVIPAAAAHVATLQAASPGGGETGADEVEARSVVPEIARVVREAAQEAARVAEAAAAASTSAARSAATTGYAAARSRAVGPTTALWHAVELARLVGAVGDACETTVCGSLVRVSAGQSWPVPARDVCPACATVAR